MISVFFFLILTILHHSSIFNNVYSNTQNGGIYNVVDYGYAVLSPSIYYSHSSHGTFANPANNPWTGGSGLQSYQLIFPNDYSVAVSPYTGQAVALDTIMMVLSHELEPVLSVFADNITDNSFKIAWTLPSHYIISAIDKL
eukprot:TRINITY_DN22492_c0_g1_i1.p1 TRINITY_DN22492_c0_g1~~TRINITY_DN22492_c0_g1_i1.p1  ORF type:complete len:141 (-),score=26.38 TRINITY_DN22492_c0_g1_i1:35-457(-)